MVWNNETRDINFILLRLKKCLDSVWGDCQCLRELQVPEINVVLCDIENSIEEYLNYTNSYKEAVDKQKEENIRLRARVNELIRLNKELTKERETNLIMAERLEKAIDLINENAQALSLSKKLKSEPRVNMHGEQHPRYITSIDNQELIKDYQSGMILKDLGAKYKMSPQGVRNRLIDLGVYKSVYKK